MVRTADSELLPIWRSDIQPVILHRLSLGVDKTAADIAASAGLNAIVVARQVRPFVDAGIVIGERVGRANVLRLNYEHPATTHLVALANLSVGLMTDLADLYLLDGVRRVVVFGSWARRHRGEPGPPPRDIDVFVEIAPKVEPWPVREACLAIAGRPPRRDRSDDSFGQGRCRIRQGVSGWIDDRDPPPEGDAMRATVRQCLDQHLIDKAKAGVQRVPAAVWLESSDRHLGSASSIVNSDPVGSLVMSWLAMHNIAKGRGGEHRVRTPGRDARQGRRLPRMHFS